LSNIKDICSKNTKDINELKNKDDENFAEVNKFISEINNKIKDIDTKIEANPISNGNNIVDTNNNNIVFTNNISTNRNITTDASNNNINTRNNNNNNTNPNPNTSIPLTINNNDELIAKIRQIESAINDLKKKLESHNESNINENIQASPIIQEQVKVIKDITTRTEELEKNMKIILGQLNIKEVYERIETLEKDLMKKCSKFELTELKEKQNILEENEKDLNYKMDQMQQFNEKIRGDMQQFIKKIEYLSGQINRLTNENADMDKGKGSIIDITKLVDLNLFNEKQKEISKKFDKIRLSFEEVARNMDEILQKLSHMPNDKDFSQFQTIIKTMIEELKLNLNKKYSDKNETSKSIKFLETQIKSIQENLQKKVDGSDNWLLAKKPLNNYVCASCENIIRGELDKRSEFVPWNKYPNREEKSYRYGHGFSRMLQLINEDRKRELKEKDSMSDGGSDSEPMLKLPKLKRLHINSGKLKNNNAQSDDENNIPFDKQGSVNNNNDLNPLFDEERPKIMKIYKRNKNVAQSSYLNRLDKIKDKDTLANLIVKTLPNSPKEGIGKNEVINVQANEE
jgi:DNA repair exonuclease SbcCD ATPase subunit